MTVIRTHSRLAIGIAICMSLSAMMIAAQDNTLSRAKDLYHTAAYDEALSLLDTLKTGNSAAEASEIAGYRVFCLLALGRVDEARKTIEGIIQRNPLFQPSEEEASPRILATFEEVRRALLPAIVRDKYQEAKASYDRKDFARAAEQFDAVIVLIDNPALASMPSRADLRTLAAGFLDLSKSMSAPKPVEPSAPSQSTARVAPAASPQRPPQASASAAPQASQALPQAAQATKEPMIYGLENTEVSPPVTVTRQVPPWTPNGALQAQTFLGAVEVVIDESGAVISVLLRKSLHPAYDPSLLRAARDWKFKPAMRQGQPVRYRYVIELRLQPKS